MAANIYQVVLADRRVGIEATSSQNKRTEYVVMPSHTSYPKPVHMVTVPFYTWLYVWLVRSLKGKNIENLV